MKAVLANALAFRKAHGHKAGLPISVSALDIESFKHTRVPAGRVWHRWVRTSP